MSHSSLRVPLLLALLLGALGAAPAAHAVTAQGDFDGDGRSDLAIGAPQDSVAGGNRAGAVNVIYGSPRGLREDPDQQFTQNTPGVAGFASEGDRFGATLAAGDFNGDGEDDLAIGVPGEDVRGEPNAGAVNVLYGGPRGLGVGDDQIWHQDTAGIKGTGERDQDFGAGLAAGDFDGDGRDDLAVGAPDDSVGGVRAAGAVNVIYGSARGLREDPDQLWTQDTRGIKGLAGSFDRFGFALAAGDVNGDGEDDLAIGAPGDTVGGDTSAGVVHVIYGNPRGLREDPDQVWHQDTPGIEGGAEEGDNFGRALAIGDLNGDGEDDLAIGVPIESIGAAPGAGAVNLIYGRRGVLREDPDQIWTQDTGGIKGVASEGDRFGSSVEIFDFSRNGRADLVIGVPMEDVAGRADAGAVNVIYGEAGVIDEDPDQLWHQGSAGIKGELEAFDNFGEALGAGDFDGDGAGDLAVGVPRDSVAGFDEAGAVNVIYGSNAGLREDPDQLWTQATRGIKGAVGNDAFGSALASGEPR